MLGQVESKASDICSIVKFVHCYPSHYFPDNHKMYIRQYVHTYIDMC